MKFLRCNFCGATNMLDQVRCRRCDSWIKLDKKASLQKAIAFWIAGLVFYIPANIYPVLKSVKFGSVEGSTIIEGVFQLWSLGDYPVALVILIASVLVPLAKFLILIYLIYTIATNHCNDVQKRVKLYYLIEITGPWSLIDVFVVLILVALIHFSQISIIPGMGVSAFALMVLFTILSARSLDIRLIGVGCEK